MDRRDFIKHVGVGFVAILGLSAVVRAMTSTGQRTDGYSSGVYGGASGGANSRKTS